jgi:glycosyltransferase involved in cell wall biosynthesis
VLFVGRLDREKRVEELLRAVAALLCNFPIRAEIIGDGSCRRELEALADQLGIRPAVRFRGVVSEVELVDAYARCAVFCMPGVAELQSLATMEAMAAGAPVVAADAMALPHLVQPGRTGWLYPPGNIDALTSRLAVLLANRRLRQQMGAAGRELVASHAADQTLDAFEALYAQAIRLSGRERGRRQRSPSPEISRAEIVL